MGFTAGTAYSVSQHSRIFSTKDSQVVSKWRLILSSWNLKPL